MPLFRNGNKICVLLFASLTEETLSSLHTSLFLSQVYIINIKLLLQGQRARREECSEKRKKFKNLFVHH